MSANERPGPPEPYDPPQVEEIPSDDGPAVTAAGQSPPQDFPGPGPEWQPSERDPDA